MKVMFFPEEYKNSLLKGQKNLTIRIDKETGKYKEGEMYAAKSYLGEDFGILIKVIRVIKTKIDNLNEFGVPAEEIGKIRGIAGGNDIEVISFEVKWNQ